MQLDDVVISKAIIERYFTKLNAALEIEVALVGGGPSNLVCGILLGMAGIRTVLFESKLAPGGGMWGGGMMFNEIVIQESALSLLDKVGIKARPYDMGYYTADSIEVSSTLISRCVRAGTQIMNMMKVEDVMFREENGEKRINGLVLQWSPVNQQRLHVDPLTIRAKYAVDGTGHPAEICAMIANKMGAALRTKTGGLVGELPMWAERGESQTIENAVEVFPGLFVTGMAANATMGAPRMGPVFGGMLLSGEKVANTLIKLLSTKQTAKNAY
ncbi:MAG: sulfide-dependent adenosine diphosphate thiazole synthase [Pseudomonadota bacterium]